MKQNIFLAIGIGSFLLSFFVHQYFIQLIVLGVFSTLLYITNKNSRDIESLKGIIEDHNKLMKEDIEELKKDNN